MSDESGNQRSLRVAIAGLARVLNEEAEFAKEIDSAMIALDCSKESSFHLQSLDRHTQVLADLVRAMTAIAQSMDQDVLIELSVQAAGLRLGRVRGAMDGLPPEEAASGVVVLF